MSNHYWKNSGDWWSRAAFCKPRGGATNWEFWEYWEYCGWVLGKACKPTMQTAVIAANQYRCRTHRLAYHGGHIDRWSRAAFCEPRGGATNWEYWEYWEYCGWGLGRTCKPTMQTAVIAVNQYRCRTHRLAYHGGHIDHWSRAAFCEPRGGATNWEFWEYREYCGWVLGRACKPTMQTAVIAVNKIGNQSNSHFGKRAKKWRRESESTRSEATKSLSVTKATGKQVSNPIFCPAKNDQSKKKKQWENKSEIWKNHCLLFARITHDSWKKGKKMEA